MLPERLPIYEVFCLLQTHRKLAWRIKVTKTYVTSIRKSITIELRRKVLESTIKDSPAITADDILTSLSLVLENALLKGVNPEEELDEEDVRELAAMPECDLYGDEEELTMLIVKEEPTMVLNEDDSLPQLVEKFTKKKMR